MIWLEVGGGSDLHSAQKYKLFCQVDGSVSMQRGMLGQTNQTRPMKSYLSGRRRKNTGKDADDMLMLCGPLISSIILSEGEGVSLRENQELVRLNQIESSSKRKNGRSRTESNFSSHTTSSCMHSI